MGQPWGRSSGVGVPRATAHVCVCVCVCVCVIRENLCGTAFCVCVLAYLHVSPKTLTSLLGPQFLLRKGGHTRAEEGDPVVGVRGQGLARCWALCSLGVVAVELPRGPRWSLPELLCEFHSLFKKFAFSSTNHRWASQEDTQVSQVINQPSSPSLPVRDPTPGKKLDLRSAPPDPLHR